MNNKNNGTLMKRLLLPLMTSIVLSTCGMRDGGPADDRALCPICHDSVDISLPLDNPRAAATTTMTHGCWHPEIFHAECLAKVLEKMHGCPLCRVKVGSKIPTALHKALGTRLIGVPVEQTVDEQPLLVRGAGPLAFVNIEVPRRGGETELRVLFVLIGGLITTFWYLVLVHGLKPSGHGTFM